MQEIAFLSLRKSKIFWGSMPPDPPEVSWSIKNPSYAPDSSCNIRICRAQLFKAEISETVMRSVMNQERLGELLRVNAI
jgi:hypothetical protein